jgi:probable phosphoglycerate mutase
MTDFLLIRHGETDWNKELRFQGQVDVPLNAIGLAQAERLQARVQQSVDAWTAHNHVPTRVVSSDLLRAQQTALPVAQALGVECLLEAGLREQCFGRFEGLRVSEIKLQHPEDWQRWLDFDADYAVTGAESTQVFHDRVLSALQRVAQQFPDEHVVVVTHGGVLDMVWRHVQTLSLHGPRVCEIPNAGWNQVLWRESALEIQNWADITHLSGMPPQPVYRPASLKA